MYIYNKKKQNKTKIPPSLETRIALWQSPCPARAKARIWLSALKTKPQEKSLSFKKTKDFGQARK